MAGSEPRRQVSAPGLRRIPTPFGEIESFVDDPITHRLERFGAHQRGELAMLRAFLRPGDQVLDVGAHIGTFAVPVTRWIGPEGRLDAFEGVESHVRLLQRNLEHNSRPGQAFAHHLLVGKGGDRYVPRSAPGNSAETWFETGGEGEMEGLRSVSLDAWWRQALRGAPIQLVKIDVEGMEPEVLAGAKELLELCRPLLYLEVHPRHLQRRGLGPEAIEQPLRDLGYEFFRNLGRRNTSRDTYLLGRLKGLCSTGRFFDILAVPSDSERFPRRFVPVPLSHWWIRLRPWLGRQWRRARRSGGAAAHLW